MVVRGTSKKYVGTVESEEKAAMLYDKYVIALYGLSVRQE